MKAVKIATYFALALAISAPPLLSADESSTRPAAVSASVDTQTAAPAHVGALRRALRGLTTRAVANNRPFTADEWEQANAFFAKYSPNRARVLASLGAEIPEAFRANLVRRWRNYDLIKDRFPALADLTLKQIGMEDDLFYLTMEARQNPDDAEYSGLIRGKVRDLVDISFQEKQLRVANLQQMLADEKQSLSRDQGREDQIVERRTQNILSHIYYKDAGHSPSSTRPSSENFAR